MTYRLEFAEDWAPVAVDERALEQIGDHPIAVITRPTGLAPAVTLDLVASLDLPAARELVGDHYWPAAEAIERLTALRTSIGQIVPDPALRERVEAELLAACDAIASFGAPVRFSRDNS